MLKRNMVAENEEVGGVRAEELQVVQKKAQLAKVGPQMLKQEAGVEDVRGLLSECGERTGVESDTTRSGRY